MVPHIWFARFALPDTTVKEFVSIPGIKLGIFCLLGECAKSSPIYFLYIQEKADIPSADIFKTVKLTKNTRG